MLKTDQSGQVQWGRTFPGTLKDVAEIAGGNYVATGFYNGTAYVVSFDNSGNMNWSKTYPGTSSGSSIEVTSGGLLVSGHLNNFFNQPLLMKINNSGDIIWQFSFGENQRGSALEGLTELPDGSFIAVGYTSALGNPNLIDAYAIRVDQNGNKLWEREYQYTSASRLYSIVQGPGSSVLIAGANNLNTGGPNDLGVLLSLDLSGNVIYSRTFDGGSGNQLWDVKFNPSNNRIYAVGESNKTLSRRQAILHVLDDAGGIISSTEYGTVVKEEVGYSLLVSNNELIISGNSFFQNADADIEYKIIKTDLSGQSQSCDDVEETVSFNVNSVTPVNTNLSFDFRKWSYAYNNNN